MSIPEAQLQTWSNQGATVSAQAAHESVRNALYAKNSPLMVKGINFEVYLQGSYKNSTNIRGNSDVDVVVQLNSSYLDDTSSLTPTEQFIYNSTTIPALYSWFDFRADVLAALTLYFGAQNVKEGDKCLKLPASPGRVAADVVPCIQYRRYLRFQSWVNQRYVEGMKFYTRSDYREVINYPKVHYDNGTNKNQRGTQEWFKSSVRMFKNARDKSIEAKLLEDGITPSYFVECLFYNAPNSLYGQSYQSTYHNIMLWLLQADLSTFLCQNEQVYLFGSTPEQWSTDQANTYIRALIALWSQWE